MLLLDEITSALDPELVGEVLAVVRQLADDGMTMIVVTHEMAFARDVSDLVVFMDGGRNVVEGRPDEVLQNPSHERLKSLPVPARQQSQPQGRVLDRLPHQGHRPCPRTAPTSARSSACARIINVSGTMTSLGASIVVPEAIARWPKASCPSSSRSTISSARRAASIAAADRRAKPASSPPPAPPASPRGRRLHDRRRSGRIEQLPDATGMKDEVLIQSGHMVGYGAPVEQALRLAGAKVVPVGQVDRRAPLPARRQRSRERTAAALYVVSPSHRAVRPDPLDGVLRRSATRAACRSSSTLASEYDLRGFLASGADIAIYSAHKFLGGPTAGIVAGRKDLVRAAFLQNTASAAA